MKYKVSHDDLGTHIEWELEGVTAHQIDWFWSNMEKGMILWHPEQHEPLEWAVAPQHGNPVGSIHIAPQTWNDGRRQNLHIRFEQLEEVPAEIRDCISLEHVIVVGGLGFDKECLANPEPLGYRLHQWQKSDFGVIGKSTAVGTRKKETVEDGKIWAEHCAQEIGNWSVFLPQLHSLYKVVQCQRRNPFADLSVEGKGRDARYKFMK